MTKRNNNINNSDGTTPGHNIHVFPAPTKERHQMYAERVRRQMAPVQLATPTRITNASTRESYRGHELTLQPVRQGAADFLALPSLHMGELRYRADAQKATP